VAGVALPLVVLGHEREAHALLGRDLLGPGLVHDVVVAGGEGLGVAEGDLVLAEVALALGRLDVEAGAGHAVADAPQQALDPGRAGQRVVDVVLVRRLQPPVPLVPGGLVGVAEDDELQLGAHQRHQVALGQAVELAAQHLAGRRHHRRSVLPLDVAQHQRRALVPRHQPQRGQVGPQHEVAVAPLPRRHGVAVDGVHVDVHRQQVVAGLGGVGHHLVEEVAHVAALALQPALHVGERHQHRVDRAQLRHLAELVDGQRGGRGRHAVTPTRGRPRWRPAPRPCPGPWGP
jgi:hypothetical protein